jgi:hypothetical protein
MASPPSANITATSTSIWPGHDAGKRAPRQHRAQLAGQAVPVGQPTQPGTAAMGHRAGPVIGYRQARRPRSTLHLRSAFYTTDLEPSQVQVSLAGQALPCIYTPQAPTTCE